MIIIPCSGMLRNVLCSGFYRRPFLILCLTNYGLTTVLAQPMTSSVTCIIGKLGYLWNKERYDKTKNATLLYYEKPFKRAYF